MIILAKSTYFVVTGRNLARVMLAWLRRCVRSCVAWEGTESAPSPGSQGISLGPREFPRPVRNANALEIGKCCDIMRCTGGGWRKRPAELLGYPPSSLVASLASYCYPASTSDYGPSALPTSPLASAPNILSRRSATRIAACLATSNATSTARVSWRWWCR